ncbi:trehalose operon repressor [Ornithinibacillus californiensis]|uniref:trehalose operon repressor n=1 Tax=Ornithinibacillus californiensis TaxID=161536 RepID=UPI00064DAA9E|nr:trehalose operon repressor [Ornithinibacillus californiensis]
MKKKYVAIYEDIASKIESKEWLANEMLPSENELTSIYETSRETVRKALNLLSQNGYIQKIQGKGSMVLDVQKFSFPVSGIVSFKELAQSLNLKSKTIVTSLAYLNKENPIYNKLEVDGYKIWGTNRVRELSGEKVILDKDYFSEEFVPILTEEICEKSIYEYIERELGLTIGFAHKEIVVENLTEEDKALLDVDGYSMVVVIKSLVYLDDAKLFQYTESRHRPDKFRFIDFARRVK